MEQEDNLEDIEIACTSDKSPKNKNKSSKRKLEAVDGDNDDGDNIDVGKTLSTKKQKKLAKKKAKQELKPSITLTLRKHFNVPKSKKNQERLKIKDIQELILYSILWHSMGRGGPNWCDLGHRKNIKKVVVIVLKSVGEKDYLNHVDCFPFILKEFNDHVVQTQASGTDFSIKHPHESLLNVELTKSQKRKVIPKSKDAQNDQDDDEVKAKYLLTQHQLKANEYPSQCYACNDVNDEGFVACVTNKVNSTEETESPVFALDCEMCVTSQGKELTRISIVDEKFNVVYDTLVKPDRPILDYKTKYSGITAELLEGVTVTLQDVQKEVQRILPFDAILAGHSLEFDLNALKMYHDRIVDTSVIFGDKRGSHFKPALRYLAHSLLGKNIQNNKSDGHCSIEDAKTVMELVQRKFEGGDLFGQTEQTEGVFHRMDREQGKQKLVTALVDYPSIAKFHQSAGNHVVARVSDSEIVSSAVSQVKTCNFVWVHLHGAHHFYEGMARDDVEAKKDVLRTLDSRVSTVCEAIPENCLTVIVMGCGDITEVIRIQKDPEPRKEELRHAVVEAKKGLCFLKITDIRCKQIQ